MLWIIGTAAVALGTVGFVYGDRIMRKVNKITTTGGHFIESAGQHAEDGAGLLGQSVVEASECISSAVSSFGNNLDIAARSMGNSIELSSKWFAFGTIVNGFLQCVGHWRIAEAIDRVNANVTAFKELLYNLPIQCFGISDAQINEEAPQPQLSLKLHHLKESALNTDFTGIMVMVIESYDEANFINNYLQKNPQRRGALELKRVISLKHLRIGVMKDLLYENFILYFNTEKEKLVIEDVDVTESSVITKSFDVKTNDKVEIRNLRTKKKDFFRTPSLAKPYLPPNARSNLNNDSAPRKAQVNVEVGAAKNINNDLTMCAYLGELAPFGAQLFTYYGTGNGLVYGISTLCQYSIVTPFVPVTGAFLVVPCAAFHGYRKVTTGKFF